MSTKTSPYRKAAGSFVSDSNAGIIQHSPRLDLRDNFERSERNPYTLASHSSKTNFIGDSVLAEGPRAVAISRTGEKRSLHLDESDFNINSNPFTVNVPTNVAPAANLSKASNMTNATSHTDASDTNASAQVSYVSNTASATKIPSITIERPRLNSAKRSKGSRRHTCINQKSRPIFTPRNLEKILTPRINEELSKKPKPTTNFNAHTQTEFIVTQTSHVLHDHHHHQHHQPQQQHQSSILSTSNQQQQQQQRSMQKHILRENAGDMLNMDSLRSIQPLRVIPPRTIAKARDYSELRNLVSALTLITIVSWLFLTYFELNGMSELFKSLADWLQSWFAKEEKQPITKAEAFLQLLRDWMG